jgi:hypothetical protein
MKAKTISHPWVAAICLLFVTLQANAFYNPSAGRWLSRDPSGESGGINLHSFTDNSPINNVDRNGLDTYICNRKIGAKGGDTSRSINNPATHTFIFITDENGNVTGTFSWGNSADPHGWNFNQIEDIEAAEGALRRGRARWTGDRDFDNCINRAFDVMRQAENSRHMNLILFLNCKTEAMNLIHEAELFQAMDEAFGDN